MTEGAADPLTGEEPKSESALTVVLAFVMNLLIAVAKSVAAAVTGSASMVADAAHSWADAGNEVFLVVAQRRAARTPDESHPLGYGREAYVWSMFAALGLFAVGAGVSITHGISELVTPEPAENFGVAYVVLGVSFVLEAVSFAQAFRQSHREARARDADLLDHVLATSDPTVRAVFAEDAAALIGIVIAFVGVGAHDVTGSTVPDAVGSILVGVLLGVVALVLLDRNRRFLVGENVGADVWRAALTRLQEQPDVARVTELRLEYVGPRRVSLVGRVDLVGDGAESDAARSLARLEARLRTNPRIAGALLTLSVPEAASLE